MALLRAAGRGAVGCLLMGGGAACSSAPAPPTNELLSTSFESLAGWGVDNPSITTEQAHSGDYAIKVQKGLDYSLTYNHLLGKLSPVAVHQLRVTGYVFSTKPTTASLTVQLMRSLQDGTSLFNENISLGAAVKKAGEWTKVSQVFALPAEATPDSQLRIYMWGATGEDVVYLDDLQVTRQE